jgi:hypothetical protein
LNGSAILNTADISPQKPYIYVTLVFSLNNRDLKWLGKVEATGNAFLTETPDVFGD